jgi:hypothetical protein
LPILPLLLAGAVAAAPRGALAETISWPFSVAGDYVLSDTTKVEIVGGVARLIPVDQTDDDGGTAGFGGGQHSGTEWDSSNGWLELAAPGTSGFFTSRVLDAGAAAAWTEIHWTPRRPYLKGLPDNGGVESEYPEGNADMTGNVFLAHLDESPCAGGDVVADSSGASNHGVLYTGEGASDKSVEGALGSALYFDGIDDYVEVPDDPGLDVTGAVTVEAWIDPTAGAGEIGEISSGVHDAYEFATVQGHDPDVVHVAGDVYAVAWGERDAGSDGWLCTVRVSADGGIAKSKIDSLKFDDLRGFYPELLRVAGDVFAIAYTGAGSDGWLVTVEIDEDGRIGDAPLDSYEFDSSSGLQPDIVHVSGDIYAVAYTGQGSDGWLATLEIGVDGSIVGDAIDAFEFNASAAVGPRVVRVSGDVYAIAYSGQGSDGWLSTVRIGSDGVIGPSTIDDMEFDPGEGTEPDVVHVAGDVYAIAYRGHGGAGRVVTVQVASDGTIGAGTLASMEFDASPTQTPDMFHLARDVYTVAYGGPDADGWLVTLRVENDGTIGAVVDRLEYDPVDGVEPCVFRVSGDLYAVAYAGADYDGFLSTFEILTERGIVKTGAYGVDADTASAYAWINDHTLSAPLSSGWNHVALVYDVDAAPPQQILYVNGEAAATAALVESIESDASPLVLGKRLGGAVDEVAILSRALSPGEIADHYKRGAVRIKYQVRTGSSDPPAATFVGPDGTAGSYYSELSNDTAALPWLGLSGAAPDRYFQYRVYLETDDASLTPELESVSFGPTHYPGDNPTVVNAAGEEYTALLSFVETPGVGSEGTIGYQLSDDGSDWYYWNGSVWASASGHSQSNDAATVDAHIGDFDEDVGAGELYFKAFLHSDAASQIVELDQVDLGFISFVVSVAVADPVFAFGTSPLNTWLASDSTVITNDGTVAEDLLGKISQFTEGVEVWGISPVANGGDLIRAQWSTVGGVGPWSDVPAYDTDFTIVTNLAASDSVTLWFRIMTPTSTSSFNQYSSTLTVTAQEF